MGKLSIDHFRQTSASLFVRILSVIDEFTHECLAIRVDRKLKAIDFTGAIHIYGGDFFGAERSEWDPETLEEGRYDVAKTMRLFEEGKRTLATSMILVPARLALG